MFQARRSHRCTLSAQPETPCAHCGAILRTDSRAFAPVEHADGLICPACDEAELADAAEAVEHGGLAAFHRAFADTRAEAAL